MTTEKTTKGRCEDRTDEHRQDLSAFALVGGVEPAVGEGEEPQHQVVASRIS